MEKQMIIRQRVITKSPKAIEEAMEAAKTTSKPLTRLKSGIRIQKLAGLIVLF